MGGHILHAYFDSTELSQTGLDRGYERGERKGYEIELAEYLVVKTADPADCDIL